MFHLLFDISLKVSVNCAFTFVAVYLDRTFNVFRDYNCQQSQNPLLIAAVIAAVISTIMILVKTSFLKEDVLK